MTSELSKSEVMVLLAVLRLSGKAYASTIRDEIKATTGRAPPTATLYVVLDRLTSQGYLTSRRSEPTPERGGRSKSLFIVTISGRGALNQALDSIDALRQGIKTTERLA